jgi:hypothetical protein
MDEEGEEEPTKKSIYDWSDYPEFLKNQGISYSNSKTWTCMALINAHSRIISIGERGPIFIPTRNIHIHRIGNTITDTVCFTNDINSFNNVNLLFTNNLKSNSISYKTIIQKYIEMNNNVESDIYNWFEELRETGDTHPNLKNIYNKPRGLELMITGLEASKNGKLWSEEYYYGEDADNPLAEKEFAGRNQGETNSKTFAPENTLTTDFLVRIYAIEEGIDDNKNSSNLDTRRILNYDFILRNETTLSQIGPLIKANLEAKGILNFNDELHILLIDNGCNYTGSSVPSSRRLTSKRGGKIKKSKKVMKSKKVRKYKKNKKSKKSRKI